MPHFLFVRWSTDESNVEPVELCRINEAQARVLVTLRKRHCQDFEQISRLIRCDRDTFLQQFQSMMFTGNWDEWNSMDLSPSTTPTTTCWTVYRLVSLVSHVLEPDPSRPLTQSEHLSAQICVPNDYLPAHADHHQRWHHFNDFATGPPYP